ncbi:MAG: hypothetical protein NDI90_09175 [Nitrospira sp. BO4]|nr:hypothetical protein [Nitrospira sp. BO4]
MSGAEATKNSAIRLPATGVGHLRDRRASRPKSVREAARDQGSHAIVLNPSDRLTVLYGHPVASRIALQVLVDHALSGRPIVYLDGVHTFDALLIGKLARGRRQQTRKALAMIHVARAFSARQLERLMSQCLAGALERYQTNTAVISGLLETLSVNGLTDNEADRLADRMIESVRHLTRQGVSLLCPCPSIPRPMTPAHRLFTALRVMSHRCIRVHEAQGKIITEELSFDPMPAYAEHFEGLGADHLSPSNPTASALPFGHAPIAQLDGAAVS